MFSRTIKTLVAFVALSLPSIAFAGGTHVYETELSFSDLIDFDDIQLNNGRKIVDIEMRYNGDDVLYSGIWGEVPGATVHGKVAVDNVAWQSFVNEMTAKDGRWLDVEVAHVGTQKLWSGIFVEDGDNYGHEIRTTMSEPEFEDKLDTNLWARRQIVDFEAYVENGSTKFAAIWAADPNQPRTSLYYHLTFAQVNDLVNPQFPIDPDSGIAPLGNTTGRVIDFERYLSTMHGEYRYALILSNHPNNGQWLRAAPLSDLEDDDDTFTDNNTRFSDIDVYDNNGQLYYLGVWQNDVKGLNEVAAVPSDVDDEGVSTNLQSFIDAVEQGAAGGDGAQIGIYAKNIRTNQSISYNADRPFYLASTSKVPMHMRLWQLDEDGDVDVDLDSMDYSNNNQNGNPWYVDDRDSNGALGPLDFGDNFTLRELDTFMLTDSDNSATSMLFETLLGRSQFNDWLARIDGIGRGFHPMTSITELDRVIMWQGQVNLFPTAQSYWFIPSWVWEPRFRTGDDEFGWLQNWVGAANPIPQYGPTTGHRRYFKMGLNSAEPRAFVLLYEMLAEGLLYSTQAQTDDALAQMGTGTPLDDVVDGDIFLPGFDPAFFSERPSVRAKNGGKGVVNDGTRVVNDTAIFTKGPDTIVMGVFSQKNSMDGDTFRATFSPGIGYLLYKELIADLEDRGIEYHQVSDTSVQHLQSWFVKSDVLNHTGGDAPPYKVSYYLSTNPVIKPDEDIFIGEYETPITHTGYGWGTVGLILNSFPDHVPPGEYYVGWIIDEANDVGEWDDSNGSNVVTLRSSSGELQTITVSPYRRGPGHVGQTPDPLDVFGGDALGEGTATLTQRGGRGRK